MGHIHPHRREGIKQESNVGDAWCLMQLHRREPATFTAASRLAREPLAVMNPVSPHPARAAQERIQELQWELLEHPPYNPNLAPSDVQLFGPQKIHLGGKLSADDEDIETEVRK
ncbi:hypothetical protein B7P43_G09047 [Cryptotermes secundus]|uniref:Tc1-like transposase DDE domain-containing protein n=1 Tax=Cryptotermes secundus TaxID=105785 RepID=A0A2J7PQ78_9NEOP|nr:hypothetical protein B7P43_G09047 [Cryptotermes secundus]